MSSLKTLLRTFSTMTNRTPRGAVAASGYKCAQIGAAILEKGGSAVDAAIASMLGEGVAVPNTMGLGGGFIMTVYIKDKGVVETLDAREVARGAPVKICFVATAVCRLMGAGGRRPRGIERVLGSL
jgi:gamma-glutamyltranspeptidase/glutathione hydrolase/leukotriene-C4 hydrolase